MVVSVRARISHLPSIAQGIARRSAVTALCTDQHLCHAGPLSAPRQRPSFNPLACLQQHKQWLPQGGNLATGSRTFTQTSSTNKGEEFIPKFYLVSSWRDNAGHNKQPKPAPIADFRPEAPTCFIVHGVFGCGKNWHPFVEKYLCKVLPEWQFVLLDSRGHGESIGAAAPHTLAACAEDIKRLAAALGRAPDVTIGHSLGGEVKYRISDKHLALEKHTCCSALVCSFCISTKYTNMHRSPVHHDA